MEYSEHVLLFGHESGLAAGLVLEEDVEESRVVCLFDVYAVYSCFP